MNLRTTYDALVSARTVPEFERILNGIGEDLGLPLWGLTYGIDSPDKKTTFWNINNLPAAYMSAYIDTETANKCPVARHCKTRSSPLFWGAETYHSVQTGDLWDIQAQFGLKAGICQAFHSNGRHLMIGFDGDRMPKSDRSRIYFASTLSLLLSTLFESVTDVADADLSRHLSEGQGTHPIAESALIFGNGPHKRNGNDSSSLDLERIGGEMSDQELEVLHWMVQSKSNWEISKILSRPETWVKRIISGIYRKMSVTNRSGAVLRGDKLLSIRRLPSAT